MPRAVLLAALAALCVALVACGDGEADGPVLVEHAPTIEPPITPTATSEPAPADTPEPTTDPTPVAEQADLGPLALEPIVPELVFNRPVHAYVTDDGAIHVAEQEGVIYRIEEGLSTIVGDLRSRVGFRGGEDGLLSVALDPDHESNRYLWTYYFADGPNRTVLSRFTTAEDHSIDPASELIVLEVAQPFRNHNGGTIRFGPDGMLYLGFGDGDGPSGPHSQDRSSLLSAIIRIDVSDASEEEPYRVPSDNPFVDEAGVPPEIWAYGLRNPWRIAFDSETGLLWVADVGERRVEEVSIATPGANLGWPIMEGDLCFSPPEGCEPEGLTPPVAVYTHEATGGCSISGGPIVRGSDIPGLDGTYLFGDLCSGQIWGLNVNLEDAPELLLENAGTIVAIEQLGSDVVVVAFDRPLQRIVSG